MDIKYRAQSPNLKRSCLRTCVALVHPLTMTFWNFAVSFAHVPHAALLCLFVLVFTNCPTLQLTMYFYSLALLAKKKKGNEMNRLWIAHRAFVLLVRFSARDQAPDYYIRGFRFSPPPPHTCHNSIIPELLQSATGMYNFSCAHYGKFSGFSRGILFSREYCPRYSWITTARGPILVLHSVVENEGLCMVKLYLLYIHKMVFL